MVRGFLLIGVVLVVLAALALLRRRRPTPARPSDVCRQHLYLFHGGQLSESAVEAAKARFRQLLAKGAADHVAEEVRPGTQFAVQVRALAEIGGEPAGRILERMLEHPLSDDPNERAWYRLDLASCLRYLNRQSCLPALLRQAVEDGPLAPYLAAEVVCFPAFADRLRAAEPAALRVLHRALVGLRQGVPAQLLAVGRLGDAVALAFDRVSGRADPLAVRTFAEALCVARRAGHQERTLPDDEDARAAFRSQAERLRDLVDSLNDYLTEAAGLLAEDLPTAPADAHPDFWHALIDLRAETAQVALPSMAGGYPHVDLAVRSLLWSADRRTGPILCRRIERRLRTARPDRPGDFPLREALRVLRGHGSAHTEGVLLKAVGCFDPTVRAAALSALGWWLPWRRDDVLDRLNQSRFDPDGGVRLAAHAALARLGERRTLQWFRQRLAGDDAASVAQTIQHVADEGLLLLWPDVDRLADADDPDVAFRAREALERLGEAIPSSQPAH